MHAISGLIDHMFDISALRAVSKHCVVAAATAPVCWLLPLCLLELFCCPAGEFKQVTAAIKLLDNDQVEQFQKRGEIDVLGHKLTTGDLRIIYQFANDGSK